MVSKKLQNIFIFSLVPIYLHGIEEILTGFQRIDSFMVSGGSYLNISTEQFYWIFHIAWWVSLPVLYLLFHKKRIALFLFSLFGLFFIFELHHIIKTVNVKSYYPGLLTALIYPFIGVIYWKELIS